ncbi:hypothetical protein AG1IA_02148 [Rhizoctonia solani AG-1 IA]|uniref:Uncharacterized protein n=1 Tax=Thanatephorus cucumeris (strain AG1-IA) TaxID=983506 RepID=L8X0K5_THACA|nr:hypothetical protein AG1IA_02148 [Rhizoctonia solani AG-1 IA]
MSKTLSSKKNAGGNRPTRPKSGKKDTKAAESAASPFTRVKLKPQRPVPTVHPASNVTGPRSSHKEGKNTIYRYPQWQLVYEWSHRYDTLHLYALGAAIPHLLLLVTSLPECLPYGPQDIRNEVGT